MSASEAVSDTIMREDPSASFEVREWVCGNHLAHSHCGKSEPLAAITTCTSSGEWKVATSYNFV